jgi:hypothetical protein
VFTFLEKRRWTGKTLVPFCTREGSGLGHNEADLRKACPGARVPEGFALKGNAADFVEAEVRAWVTRLDLGDSGS